MGRPAEHKTPRGVSLPTFWRHVFDEWGESVSCDLLETYGIDTFAEDFPDRSWHSVRARIDGLLSTRSRLAAWLASHDIKEPT